MSPSGFRIGHGRVFAIVMSDFEVPQVYETSLAMRSSDGEVDREFLFMCVPVTAIAKGHRRLLESPAELLSELLPVPDPAYGAEVPVAQLRVAQLPDAIFTLLAARPPEDTDVADLVSRPDWLVGRRAEDPAAALFAEYLAFAEVVPFEQSKLSATALASLARKSYDKAWKYAGASGFAPILGPHGAVVFLAGLGAALGALVVIDSFGVAVGFVSSDSRTGRAIRATRRWIRRILRRPPPADQEDGAPTKEAARAAVEALEREKAAARALVEALEREAVEALEGEQEQVRLAHEKLLEAEEERQARVAAKQQALKAKAPKIKLRPA